MKKKDKWIKKYLEEPDKGKRHAILLEVYSKMLIRHIQYESKGDFLDAEREDILYLCITKFDKVFYVKSNNIPKPDGYIKQIAKNEIITKWRKHRLKKIDGTELEDLEGTSRSPEEEERQYIIRFLLQKIGKACRSIFIERHAQEKKLVDMAKERGIRADAMRSRLRNCKNKMLQIIKDNGFEGDFSDILN